VASATPIRPVWGGRPPLGQKWGGRTTPFFGEGVAPATLISSPSFFFFFFSFFNFLFLNLKKKKKKKKKNPKMLKNYSVLGKTTSFWASPKRRSFGAKGSLDNLPPKGF
jgi:hypothetical protein